KAMATDFNDFVRSDTVFWQLTDSGPFLKRYPKFTLAGLLLCQHKLAVFRGTLSAEKQAELQQVQAEIDQWLSSWRSNVERKALREIGGRLHSWEWYLSDCRVDPGDCAAHYATEVYARVYIHFLVRLLSELPEVDGARAQVGAADAELRTVFRPGAFVWEANLGAAFSSEEYWFLYGRPGRP
ncbi:MAG: hypothetical protein QF376_05340, partial [Anaerolineales bacterium]|nr:hypothetical protein [Anaerolineales bacterium]